MRFPLIKIPSDVQFILYLIKEELKSRRFFRPLHRMGLNDCYFQPHLDTLILRSLGMNDESDETFHAYNEIMERRSKRIDADNESTIRQALKAYHELLDQKTKERRTKKDE